MEAFFQGFYSTLSHFVAYVRTYPEVFGDELPHRSMAKFLQSWITMFPADTEAVQIIEAARQHRAFLDHAPGLPAYGLWTMSAGPHELDVSYYGDFGKAGVPPEGARTLPYFIDSQWHKDTPSYRNSFAALQYLVQIASSRIATHYGADARGLSPIEGIELDPVSSPTGLQLGEFEPGSVNEYIYDPNETQGRAIRALADGTVDVEVDRGLETP